MSAPYTIGEAAQQTGVTAHTLRYYEKIGLLNNIDKDASGKRIFSAGNLQLVHFIKRAQRMQFSLDEIKQLITLDQAIDTAKPEARKLVKYKLSDIDETLQELQRLRQDLSSLLDACEHSDSTTRCPILEGIKEET